MIKLLVQQVQPKVILSTGTAGGARTQDHIGTVRAVSAGTSYEPAQPAADWPEYANDWKASGQTLANPDFSQLLLPIPINAADLQSLCTTFTQNYHTNTLAELDPNGLNRGDATLHLGDDTGGRFPTDNLQLRGRHDDRDLSSLCVDRDG